VVLPTNHDLPSGFATGQLTFLNWGRSALSAAFLFAGFALLFAIGGWATIGTPPKPFAPAEGFFVSGIQLQTLALAVMFIGLVTWGARFGPFVDRGLVVIWHLASVSAVLPVAIIFLWASARFLFGLSTFPPDVMPVSFSETWWIELALALFGFALAGGIPVLLRWGGHVSIDVLTARAAPQVRKAVTRFGTLFLSLPFGWILLTKGSSFAARSWTQWEGSQNFGIEFVFLVKTLVPLMGFLIVVVSALSLHEPIQTRQKAASA